MQQGVYFVSDEAEKAAIGDEFQRYQEAERKADLLSIEMGKIGKEIAILAEALWHLQGFALLPEAPKLTIGKLNAALTRPVAELPDRYMNLGRLAPSHVDYQDAITTKAEFAARLRIKS